MDNVPSNGLQSAQWRSSLGCRSPADQDLPPSDGAGAQYFDYDAYAAETVNGGHQDQREGGDEMCYDAESHPLEQSGLRNFTQANQRDYEQGRNGANHAEDAQWHHEAVQYADQLVEMYNDETWERASVSDQSRQPFTDTPAAYDQTDAQPFDDATSFAAHCDTLPSVIDHDMAHQHQHDDNTIKNAPLNDCGNHAGADEDEGDEEDEEGDDDQKVLAAASQNYYADDLLRSSLVPAVPLDYLEQPADLADYASVESQVDTGKLNNDGRWQIDKEAMAFLNHVVVDTDKDYMELLLNGVQTGLRDLKVEEPVLLIDPQMDMMKIIERSKLRLTAEGLKPHKLNDDKDESLMWPAKYTNLPAQVNKKIDRGRLDLDVETIDYLKEIHEGPNLDVDTWLYDERKRRTRPQYVSPKLLPMSPPCSPTQLPPAIANMPLLSTPKDPNERELAELDKMLREKDDAAMEQLAEDSAYSSFGVNTDRTSSPLRRKTKRSPNLKVSDPILPAENAEPPAKKQKTVIFPEELHTLIPPVASSDTDTIEAVDNTFATVQEMLKQLAAPAIEMTEGEELDEVDTTMRAAVPKTEAYMPIPPWSESKDDDLDPHRARPRRAALAQTIDDFAKTDKKCSGISRLERYLPWSAFASHLGRLKAEGDFDDGSAARYVAGLDDGDVDLERLTHRPDKRRLLIVDEFDEDELEPLDFEDGDDEQELSEPDALPAPPVPAVPKLLLPKDKTGRAICQKVPSLESEPKPAETSSFNAILRRRKEELENTKEHFTRPQKPSTVPTKSQTQSERQQEIFGGGLTQHLSMHGVSHSAVQAPFVSAKHAKAPAHGPPQSKQQAERQSTSAHTVSIPLPVARQVESILPVVVCSTILKTHQSLIRSIQKSLPTLEIIERDYSATVSSENTTATVAREAHMTISPSTGLIFTNLQKLKQKPLPGQKSYFGIHQQISRAAPRYERLIVLVSGRTAGTGVEAIIQPIDESDTAAVTDLIGLATMLDSDVEVIHTAGDNNGLAHWTAALITQHACGHSCFLPEETTWERFLRRAGMNAYAAQVLLEQLKSAVMVQHSGNSHTRSLSQYGASGLGAFVAMSAEERMYRFADVLGGWRVMRRVCEMIDGPLIPVQPFR
ncbi:hypothetical protein DOTSEDRAFT_37443 [Dothistroma septosporum NZE10]|uniref:Uncharacterized protein n=1 Tax=Dothistroma septosporum (strain NZE10 / CBS 128990) TaxID=675120 RepID=N1PEZ0_DOTSN|nr:hypothetical protein DOTSEDRAFT_37443 [Dothistroma septosporum NZE10]